MKDIFLIMNPGAHSGLSKRSFKKILQLFDENGRKADYCFTSNLHDARDRSREANLQGYKIIVAVGGDGTINAVINGFFNRNGYRISLARFGVIYTGTSPDFNKSYGIPVNISDAVNTILHGNVRSIPVGKISFGTPLSSSRGSENSYSGESHYFVCCANIGLGAHLARKANSGIRKWLGDFCGTLLLLIILLFKFKSFTLNLKENNQEYVTNKMVNLSVGITPFIASGIRVALPSPASGDEFYLLTTKNMTTNHIIPLIYKVYSGKPFQNSSYLQIKFTREVTLSSGTPIEVEADGDPVGFLPCHITLIPGSLELMVPQVQTNPPKEITIEKYPKN